MTIFNEKTEIRNYFLRVLVAQSSCKTAPNHLGGDQKNQELIMHFFHLREVGPSRKILHARGVGFRITEIGEAAARHLGCLGGDLIFLLFP